MSIDLPPLMHAADAPLPRCATTMLISLSGFFRCFDMDATIEAYEIPWKPYLRNGMLGWDSPGGSA